MSVKRSIAVIFSVVLLLPVCTRSAHAATPAIIQTADCIESVQGGSPNSSGQYLTCEFGQPTKAGNAIVVSYSSGVTAIDLAVTDNGSNAYTCYQEADGGNNQNVVLCVAPNAAPASQLKFTATADIRSMSGPAILEVTNVGPVDVTPVGNTGTSDTITSGSFTPATTGDFVCQIANQDGQTSTPTTFTVGSQANITWAFAAQDRAMWTALQCGVYNSTAALNPGLTQGSSESFVSLSIALKATSAGSAPSGMYITALKHLWLTTDDSQRYYTTSPRTEAFACPAASNLAYFAWIGATENSDTITAVTINGTSMTQTGAAYNGSADSITHNYYYQDATLGPNQTLVMTGSFTTPTAIAYCITGAATSAFKQTATNSGDATSESATLGPTIADLTPEGSSGITFAQVGVSLNTVIGTDGSGNIHSCFYSNEALSTSGCDQNNGWGALPFSSSASQSFSWNLDSSTTAVGAWASRADEFDAGSSIPPVAPTLSSIAVTPADGETTFAVGQTNQLTATATYSDGSTTNCDTADPHGNLCLFTSSSLSVGTVTSSGGLFTAVAAGTTGITANAAGITSPSLNLTVNTTPAAPTVSLTANPTSITSGGSSTLTVTATNATQVTVGSITLGDTGGTVVVSPTVTTTYTATATGAGGTTTAATTVTVAATPPPVNSLAEPTGFTDTVSGTTVTLTWTGDGNAGVAVCGTTHISCINSLLLRNVSNRSRVTIYSCSGAACLVTNEYSITKVAKGTHTYALTVSGYNSRGAVITSPEATTEATVR